MKTEIERICEIMETLLAHEPIIDVPYETINDIAVALVQEGYGNVKQAQIDVLNELKEKKSMNKHYANIEALKASLSQSGPTYSSERLQADIRSLSSTTTLWDIDEMIEEIENDRI